MTKNKLFHFVFLILVPLVYLLSYTQIGAAKGPYWWTPNQDPDYAYLLTSLTIANLNIPGHTDHPGTPLQILGGIILRLSHLIQSWFNPSIGNITKEVLINPELYLGLINYTLLSLTTGCLFLLGLVSFQICKNLPLSLILQTTPFVVAETMLMQESSRVAPEALLFCISQLLVLLLVTYLYVESAAGSKWFSISLGIVFGLGMATKVTFLPMILFFLLVSGTKGKALALIAAITSFIFATSPIISQYGRVGNWLLEVATHTGSYRTGETGLLIETSSIVENFNKLVSSNPVFFTLVGISTFTCALLFWFRQQGWLVLKDHVVDLQFKRLHTLFTLSVLTAWIQVFITVNEHGLVRYLLPSVSLCGFLIFLLTHFCLGISSAMRGCTPNLSPVLTSIALAICVGVGIQQMYLSSKALTHRYDVRRADLESIQRLVYEDERYNTCVKIVAKRASSIESALYFGNIWTGRKFSAPLSQIHPNAVFYEPRRQRETYVSYTQKLDLAELFERGQGCVLLQSNPFTGRRERFRPNTELEDIFVGKTEAVYRMKPN